MDDVRSAEEGVRICEPGTDIAPCAEGAIDLKRLTDEYTAYEMDAARARTLDKPTSSAEAAVCARGSSTPSTVPPDPLRRLASSGRIPKMWSPGNPRRSPPSLAESYASDGPTMRVRNEDLADLPNFYGASLKPMLGGLTTVEEPDITTEPESERGVVAC